MASSRKKSPKVPAMSLSEAVDRALKVYDRELLNPVPSDAVAQDMGYKDARGGASIQALASLKGYGLLEVAGVGQLAMSPEVEDYKFTPDENHKLELLRKWVRKPRVFEVILEKYPRRLPSDTALQYDLVKMGFTEKSAKSCLQTLKESTEFARYFEGVSVSASSEGQRDEIPEPLRPAAADVQRRGYARPSSATPPAPATENSDRIPVRLTGGRRAWVELPVPFFEKDKKILKAQIDLIVTDEEGAEENSD